MAMSSNSTATSIVGAPGWPRSAAGTCACPARRSAAGRSRATSRRQAQEGERRRRDLADPERCAVTVPSAADARREHRPGQQQGVREELERALPRSSAGCGRRTGVSSGRGSRRRTRRSRARRRARPGWRRLDRTEAASEGTAGPTRRRRSAPARTARSPRAGRSGSRPGGLSGRQRMNVVPWRKRSPCRWS